MNVLEQEKVGRFTVKFYQDEDADSPRNWDNLGTMICFHRRYELGDKHKLSVEEAIELEKRADVVALPLYLYDHSGLRMKVGSFQGLLPQGHAEFDSSGVGFIYVTKEGIKKEYGKVTKATLLKAKTVLENEVKTYDQYLSGDVYGYVIEDEDGEHMDSCWGFFGWEYALAEGKDMAKWYEDKAPHQETLFEIPEKVLAEIKS